VKDKGMVHLGSLLLCKTTQ